MLTVSLRQWGKHEELSEANIKLPSVANTWEHSEDTSSHGLFLFSIKYLVCKQFQSYKPFFGNPSFACN